MAGRFAILPIVKKIWHAPDHIHMLDPLPLMHRRGVIAGIILVAIGILLPSEESAPPVPVVQDSQIDIPPPPSPSPSAQQVMPLPPITTTPIVNDEDQIAPVTPEPVPDEIIEQNPAITQPRRSPTVANRGTQQWSTYHIEAGKTLAQLFRDNNLPPTDVYAMVQVEGADKPLSSLKSGQTVQIRQNSNRVVTGLAIDTESGQQIMFTRQSDGRFIRTR